MSDGSDLVAEKVGWFGQGWNSPSHTTLVEVLALVKASNPINLPISTLGPIQISFVGNGPVVRIP